MSDWWYARAVEHGLAIVMPDGGEVVLPKRVAQRFAVAVWEQMSLNERSDAVQFVQRGKAKRQEEFEPQAANHQELLAAELVYGPPLPRPDIVDLSLAHGDPAQDEPLPDAWARPVRAGGTVLFAHADDDEATRRTSESSFRAHDEAALRLHEEWLARWGRLTDGQRRNYRKHDWQAHRATL